MSLDFDCAVCGNPLEVFTCPDGSGYNITPCESCTDREKSEAYDRGYEYGYRSGRDGDEPI